MSPGPVLERGCLPRQVLPPSAGGTRPGDTAVTWLRWLTEEALAACERAAGEPEVQRGSDGGATRPRAQDCQQLPDAGQGEGGPGLRHLPWPADPGLRHAAPRTERQQLGLWAGSHRTPCGPRPGLSRLSWGSAVQTGKPALGAGGQGHPQPRRAYAGFPKAVGPSWTLAHRQRKLPHSERLT